MHPEPEDLFRRLDALGGREFELVVARLFRQDGYDVELTKHYDWGADLVATKEGERSAIQVKRWKGAVREDAVRTVFAAKDIYKCDRAMVVTNSTFTKRATQAARKLDVSLWNRERLARQIQWFCAACGVKVSPRVKGWCLSRPDQFHGSVYCFEHQTRMRGGD